MTTFATRAPANDKPDTMGDTYEFIKLDLDAFIAFVDGLGPDVKIHRDTGPTEMFLNETRPDFHWYVVPDRIYFTSNAPYPDDQLEILTEPRTDTFEYGWPCSPGMTYEHTWPVGWVFNKGPLHSNCFSETQKWVNKIEGWVMNHPTENLTAAEVRELIRKATGK